MNEQIQPQQVRHVLLGSEAKGSYSWLDFNAEIRRGLPVEAVRRLAEAMAPRTPGVFEALVVSRSTLKRHRLHRKPLNPEHSERLGQLAEVWAMAVDVYKDEETARLFLQRPHQLLHGRPPLEVAAESWAGARSVEQILGRLKYGSAA